ncbi:maintenance of telomere capping protein 1 [Scheffersomyces xylosifermentans]|uniref:maintenance of telomere capping protein 1 n=1 Tax=Scheffersomyces xylosifermentans TaxID=1304137 RepID=UPI00315C8F10
MAPPTTEAEDVLDFINSLPDSKSGTPKPSKQKDANVSDINEESESAASTGKDEDFLEFLDELAQHEKKTKTGPASTSPSKAKFEPKKKLDSNDKDAATDSNDTSKDSNETGDTTGSQVDANGDVLNANEELEIDPLSSITSWWSTEGSTKVSSLWGTIASNAQTIGETTYQIASNTTNQLNQQRQKFQQENTNVTSDLAGRLNSIVLNMSQQIKQGLIDDDDELLNILVVYDLYNLQYVTKLIANNFNAVMGQVEGGIRVTVNDINHKSSDDSVKLNMFYGKVIDGEKLCFANLESAIKNYLKIMKESEPVRHKEEEDQVKEHTEEDAIKQINKSNVFISIQPITTSVETDDSEKSTPSDDEDKAILIESNNADSFSFTVILKDITNNITIITKTQPFPLRWAKWLDGEGLEQFSDSDIDPREWIRDWIKQGLDLSFGVIAQKYVIKRMGI